MIRQVYLIDDDPVSIYLTQFALEQVGFSHKIAAYQDAKQALTDILTANNNFLPEVIFLDLNMPGMNGQAFLEALVPRQQDLLGRLKIFILSSTVDPEDRAMAAAYPLVAGFLIKPLEENAVAALKQELSAGTP